MQPGFRAEQEEIGLKDVRAHQETLLSISTLTISLVLLPVLLQSTLFLAGVSLSVMSFAFGLAIGVLLPIVLRQHTRGLWLAYVVVSIVVVAALAIQGGSWDNTHDSLTYHEPAAISIGDGVNPMSASLGHVLADHYPKASLVFSGGVYALTGNIEYGKILTVLFALASFGVAGAFFLAIPGIRISWAYVLAAVAALNPVTVAQLDTHYVDGLFASLGLMLVLIAVAESTEKIDLGGSRTSLPTLGVAAAVLLANLKFTGLVFVVALVLGSAVWRALKARRGADRAWKPTVLPLVALVLGILIVGFNPYITNLYQQGNPFYPLFSPDLARVPDPPDVTQRPVPYREVPAPVAFLMSLTEQTSTATDQTMAAPYRLKNPLSVTRDELVALQFPDARRGGYGPLFFLALIAAAALSALMLLRRKTVRFDLPLEAVAFGTIATVVLTLLMVESWWARLAPILFLVPLLIAVAGLSAEGRSGRAARLAAIAVVVILCANGLLALVAQGYDYRNRAIARTETLAALDGAENLHVRFPDPWVAEMHSRALVRRLEDAGFEVEVISAQGQSQGEWTYYPALRAEVGEK